MQTLRQQLALAWWWTQTTLLLIGAWSVITWLGANLFGVAPSFVYAQYVPAKYQIALEDLKRIDQWETGDEPSEKKGPKKSSR